MKNLILFIFLINTCFAQTIVTDIEDPFIEVTGTAEMEVIPDEIYISLILKERFENKVKIKIEDREYKLKEKIKLLGLNPEELLITSSKTAEVKTGKKTSALIKENDYLIKIHEPGLVTKLINVLQTDNIDNISIVKINHSNIEKYKSDVKQKALRAAKIKAENLLSAIGEVPGKPIFIIENDNEKSDDNKEANHLKFLKIIIYQKVIARFEIE